MFFVDLLKATIVRLVLLVHSLLVIWLAASITANTKYWILTVAHLGMLVEAYATLVKHKAQEWKWFCPCFFFYLCSTIPGIWVLELHRMDTHQGQQDFNSFTDHQLNNITDHHINNITDHALKVQGVDIPIELATDTSVLVMEQLFLYLMILGRWILPRGQITRDELSQLLFVFIGIASDITELFALFEENKVRESTKLTYAILCVWTISLLQFTFVLTSTNSPKKMAVQVTGKEEIVEEPEEAESNESIIAHVFQTEAWSICINFLFQDGPFLTIRMYIMFSLNVLTYSIIFFTAKNLLLIILLVYRMCVLCLERHAEKKRKAELAAQITGEEKDATEMI